MFSKAFKWYSNQLLKRPYTTQIISSGILWTSADYVTQKVVDKNENINKTRLYSTSAYGTFVAGPLFCWWYDILDRNTRHMVGIVGPNRFILTKIALDQLLFEPFNLTIYYLSTNLFEGKTLTESLASLRRDFATAFIADCLVWPIAQSINFKYVPVHLQALYVNSFSLGWAAFLTFLNHRTHETPTTTNITSNDIKVLKSDESKVIKI